MTTMTPRELSPRQREILALVAAGRTSKEIAGTLGISESTVNWHLANVFDRLGASSRAEAVALAMREAQDVDAPDEPATPKTPQRLERSAWTLSSIALAIGLTLVLGMFGGALMAGWNFTAPTWPSSSVAPSTGAPQRGEPTVRPSGAGAPAQEVEAAPVQPSAQESVPGATTVPETLGPLPLRAPSLPTIAPALPPLVPTLQTIAPTTSPVVGPLLPPAPSLPPGLPSLPLSSLP